MIQHVDKTGDQMLLHVDLMYITCIYNMGDKYSVCRVVNPNALGILARNHPKSSKSVFKMLLSKMSPFFSKIKAFWME